MGCLMCASMVCWKGWWRSWVVSYGSVLFPHPRRGALWKCTPARALHNTPHPGEGNAEAATPRRGLCGRRCTPARALHLCTPARALHAPSMKLAMDGSVWVVILATRYWPRGLDPRWPASPGLGLFPASGRVDGG